MAETKLDTLLNPRNALPENFKFGKKTLLEKFKGFFWLSFGAAGPFTGNDKSEGFTLGIVGWILLLPFTPLLLLAPLFPLFAPIAPLLTPIMPLVAALAIGVYSILNIILTAALMIVASPFIVVAHAIWGPKNKAPNAITPVRRSFWLNPLTYVMAAILAVGISLLIQGVNPAVFLNAAAPLMVAQTVLMGLAVLAVLGAMLYVGYRVALGIFSKNSKKKNDGYINLDEDVVLEKIQNLEIPAKPTQNYLTKYLNEHWEWMKANWGKAGFFYGLMFVGVGAVTLLVANYFTAGLLFGAGTEGFMKLVFDFMVTGFTSGLQSMAGLPGLDFLAASDATLLLVGQILTVFTLTAAAFVIPYTGARLCQSGQEEFPSKPDVGNPILGRKPGHSNPGAGFGSNPLRTDPEPKPAPQAELYKVRALHDFRGQQIGDLAFMKGDVLSVLEDQEDPDWWEARNASGQVGPIPANYMERINPGSNLTKS